METKENLIDLETLPDRTLSMDEVEGLGDRESVDRCRSDFGLREDIRENVVFFTAASDEGCTEMLGYNGEVWETVYVTRDKIDHSQYSEMDAEIRDSLEDWFGENYSEDSYCIINPTREEEIVRIREMLKVPLKPDRCRALEELCPGWDIEPLAVLGEDEELLVGLAVSIDDYSTGFVDHYLWGFSLEEGEWVLLDSEYETTSDSIRSDEVDLDIEKVYDLVGGYGD